MGKNDSSEISIASWPIRLKKSVENRFFVPSSIWTYAPSIPDDDMPPEVSVLLPTRAGSQSLIDVFDHQGTFDPAAAIGLFMSDPFLAVQREARRLKSMNVDWVSNLPTVEQHDDDFTQQLADVGLDRSREYTVLDGFKAAGLKVVVIITSAEGAVDALSLMPDVFIVIPRVSDFAAGFPSPRQRGAAAQLVRDAITDTGWNGPLLGYGDDREIEHPSQWPDTVDGMLFRPTIMQLGKLSV